MEITIEKILKWQLTILIHLMMVYMIIMGTVFILAGTYIGLLLILCPITFYLLLIYQK